MHVPSRLALTVTTVLAATLAITASPVAAAEATAPEPVPANAVAVRSTVDYLAEGADVSAYMVNVQYGSEVNSFLALRGAGDINTRVEVDLRRSQLDGLAPGTYSLSYFGDPTTTIWSSYYRGSSGCTSPGRMNLLEPPSYGPGGALTGFAADLTFDCGVDVQLRYGSTVPWSQLVASATPVGLTAVVNEVRPGKVTYMAHGNSPITAGAAAIDPATFQGYPYWGIVSDGCAGHTLVAGQTCDVDVRFAPLLPNGAGSSSINTSVTVPDGRTAPARAAFAAVAVPLANQAVAPFATGHYHRMSLNWGQPVAVDGYQGFQVDHYDVYELSTGTPVKIATTYRPSLNIPGLATGYRNQYQVRAVMQNGQVGAASLPSPMASTARRELFFAQPDGVAARALDPASPSQVIGGGYETDELAVGADGRWLAYASIRNSSPPESHISVQSVDDLDKVMVIGTLYDPVWRTDPAVAPDSSAVVFTESTVDDHTNPVLRRWDRLTQNITNVPGGAGLTQATYTPDGQSLIAVEQDAAGPHLVRLSLATGVRQPIAGSEGAQDPAVAADGRIAFAHLEATAGYTTLRVLPAQGGTPVTLAGVPTGKSEDPSWDPAGDRLQYAFREVWDGGVGWGAIHELDLTTDADTVLATDNNLAAPVVLAEPPALPPSPPVDRSAPSVVMTAPAATITLSASWAATWRATDAPGGSGVASADVRFRVAAFGHGFGALSYPAAGQRMIKSSYAVPVSLGSKTCVSVRARDRAGNTSAWTAERCVVRPLDDRSFTLGTGARRGSSTAHLNGTYTSLTATGAKVSRAGASGKRVAVVGTVCAKCGSVKVYLGSTYLGTVSFTATKTAYKRVFYLPARTSAIAGTLTIRATSTRPVYLDAVAAWS